MNFKKGDRVLLEARYSTEFGDLSKEIPLELPHHEPLVDDVSWVNPDHIHPHPGVPVADLLEECELCAELGVGYDHSQIQQYERLCELRAAREAAQVSAGQTWVKASPPDEDGFVTLEGGWRYRPDPNDIRTEDK